MKSLRLPLALALTTLLTGCGALTTQPAASPAGQVITGSLHGGQQPISGSSIQLYSVGTLADGSAATPLLATPATTLSDGSFNFTLASPCPGASTLVYLAATGGNPGLSGTVNNTAIAGLLAIGTCTTLAQSTYLSIDEVTTVAAVNALAPYLTSPAAIGSSSSDASALASAFTLATQFANNASGKSPGVNIPSGYAAPYATIDTLADIIAPCINSNGTDGNCANLFSYTTPTGSSTAPTDTVGALLNVALNPTLNTSSLYSLSTPSSPFQPNLGTQPANFAVALIPTTTTLSFSALSFPSAASTYPTPQQDLVVTNTGSITATFATTPVTITGTNASEFSQLNDCVTLAPGASCDVLLIATPGANGSRTATLNFSANTLQAYTVPLAVTGRAPAAGPVSQSITSFTFYTGGTYQDVTFTNQGTTPLTFKAPTTNGYVSLSIPSNTCTGMIAAGASCTITFLAGTDRGTSEYYTINDDAAAGPQSIAIQEIVSSSVYASTAFTSTALGSSSTVTYTVSTNANGSAASYSGSITGAAAADYSPSTVGCYGSGAPLSPGFESCSFTLKFTPSAAGPRVARLGSGGYLPLTGYGGPIPPTSGPAFSLPSSSSIYATFNANNTASANATVTLVNTGSTTLAFPALTFFGNSPGMFSQTNNCASVASGSSCQIVVIYNTSSTGGTSANLVVKDSTSGLSQSVAISAAAYYPSLTLTPSTLGFGSQPANTTTTETFTVSTNGAPIGRAITVSAYSGSTSLFTFPNGTTCAASTTAVCTFTVAFTPTTSGAVSAQFKVLDQTGNVSSYETITGTGVTQPQASFAVSSIGFANTSVGTTSTTSTTLSSTGGAPLSISSISITGSVNSNFTQTNNCPASLASGSSCTINLTFSPKVTGSQSATLQVVSNSVTSPDTVALSGTGK